MAFVVTEPCISVKDHACVDVCPVDCIYEAPDHLVIHPEECIDCGACVPECPVEAIFEEGNVPDKWKEYTARNAAPFQSNASLPKAFLRQKWETQRLDPSTAAHAYYTRHGKA